MGTIPTNCIIYWVKVSVEYLRLANLVWKREAWVCNPTLPPHPPSPIHPTLVFSVCTCSFNVWGCSLTRRWQCLGWRTFSKSKQREGYGGEIGAKLGRNWGAGCGISSGTKRPNIDTQKQIGNKYLYRGGGRGIEVKNVLYTSFVYTLNKW